MKPDGFLLIHFMDGETALWPFLLMGEKGWEVRKTAGGVDEVWIDRAGSDLLGAGFVSYPLCNVRSLQVVRNSPEYVDWVAGQRAAEKRAAQQAHEAAVDVLMGLAGVPDLGREDPDNFEDLVRWEGEGGATMARNANETIPAGEFSGEAGRKGRPSSPGVAAMSQEQRNLELHHAQFATNPADAASGIEQGDAAIW